MLKSKKWALLSGFMLVSLILTACQGQEVQVPVTVVVRETQQVEVEVVQTQIVQQTQVVEVEVEGEVEAFSRPHPILSDLRVRQAIAYCSNRDEMIASVYPIVEDPSTLRMDSFIPTDHWAHASGLPSYDFDPEMGAQLLDEAGWTLGEGAAVRSNEAGDTLSLKFTTTNAAFRQTWGAVFVANMAACGIEIVPLYAPASWWFGDTTGLARRDFELGAFAWVGEADPPGSSLYACDQIPLPSNNWEGQNSMGWCNEAASNAIKAAHNTLIQEERIEQFRIVQEEFAKDMISLPLFNRVEYLATNIDMTGFAPAAGEPYAAYYNVHELAIPGQDTIVMGFTQEPASLWPIVESAFVANAAYSLIGGRTLSSLEYEWDANLYVEELPTLENGGAVLETVDVADGDMVVDANGELVELAAGVSIKDGDGNVVEYSGGGATMQQMAITWTVVDGITWSDGEPLKAADMQLAQDINCDPESGAISFFTCERTANVEFTDTSGTITLVPGYTPSLYFTVGWGGCAGPCWYPSHRVTSDGRTLADVPAAEWTTLPEIAENPIGVGPYVITEWVKGEKMVFEANPYFYGGAPKTPNIVISFLAPENAEAQLIGGQVDILDFTTLVGVSEALDAAEEAGQVRIINDPSASWEHIDFNLFLP